MCSVKVYVYAGVYVCKCEWQREPEPDLGISHVFGMNSYFILKLLPGLSSYFCASFSSLSSGYSPQCPGDQVLHVGESASIALPQRLSVETEIGFQSHRCRGCMCRGSVALLRGMVSVSELTALLKFFLQVSVWDHGVVALA